MNQQINEKKTQSTEKTGELRTLVNFRPVLFCAFFFAFGVWFYKQCRCGVSPLWTLLAVLPFFSLLLFRDKQRLLRTLYRTLAIVCAFFCGIGAFALQVFCYESGGRYNGEYFVVGIVDEYALEGEVCRVVLSDLEIDGNTEKGALVAYLPYTYAEKLTLNDRLALHGKVKRSALDFEDPYFAYTVEKDLRFDMNAQSVTTLGNDFRLFPFLREKITDVLYAGLDETTAAVTMALLTGDVRAIDDGLLDNVRYGGIAHVFAVSGLHVGVLYGFCLWLMNRKGLKRLPKPFKIAFVALTLLFYGGVCGYSSSIIRATVTCLIAYGAKLVGLNTDSGESIGASALVVTAFSPISLFTAGFQLSFAACFGIVWLSKPIEKLLLKPLPVLEDGEEPPLSIFQTTKRKALQFFAVTLSAQIATSPIQILSFGYLSVWSVFLNILFVPLISALFSILLALVTLSCILPVAWTSIILYIPNVLWTVLLLAFEVLDFSKNAITGITLNGPIVTCYYLICLFMTDKLRLPKKIKIYLAFFCALVLLLSVHILSVV